MLIGVRRGQGSVILRVKILNSSVSTGAGLTGLSSTSSGLIISTIADTESTATAYTAAASNIETITTNGTFSAPTAGKCRFKELDATNHKGVYEIQIADARFNVSNAKSLLVSVAGATNAAETDVVIPLRDLDPFDAVRAGLTALPNVASGSAGAIITSGTGTAQLSVSSGQVTVATNNDKSGYSLSGSQTFSTSGSVGSVTGSVGSVTGAVGSVTGAVGSVTGNVGGNVAGSVNSVVGTVTANTTQWGGVAVTGMPMPTYTQPTGFLAATFPTTVASPTNITAGTITTVTNVTNGVTVATNNDKTGYSLSQTFPANFAALGINASGHLSRVTLVDTCTTNTDMRGTDNAALAASWTATRAGYLDSVLLAANANQRTVQVNGNGHVASVLHSSEPDSITVGAFAADSITASALAASAATEIATATLTSAMTESYRAAGVAPTLAQAAFELLAHMGDSSISGTTKTLKKIDGTTAKTFTLDSSTAPTSITEAT